MRTNILTRWLLNLQWIIKTFSLRILVSLLPRLSFLCVSALMMKRLLRKTSCAFSARYSHFALVAYFSRTMLNRVFDKDYILDLMLFRATNLSALLLPYFTVMLFFYASPWQWEPTGVSVFCFVFVFFLFQCWSFWEWCPFPCFLIHLGFFPFPSIVFHST